MSSILNHYDNPVYSEREMLEMYVDSTCPYPAEFEVHTRTSQRSSVREPRPAPQHASDFRADMVLDLPESEVVVEAKQFDFRSPWIENGHLYDGIGQVIQYGHFYDLAELWHFVTVPKPQIARRDAEMAERAERICEDVYDYFCDWFDGLPPFGYRIIGLHNVENGVEWLFTHGSSAIELGYNPEATGDDLNYPFQTTYEPDQ